MTAIITAIIITSVLAFTLPNQVFAQGSGMQIFVRNGMGLGQTIAGHEAQAGKVLEGHDEEIRMLFPEAHQIGCIIDHLAGRPC